MRCRTHHLAIFCGYSLTLLLLLGEAGFPCAARGQKRPDRKKLVVVCDDNYPPYSFREASGKVRGILPEQWALWEQKTGVQVDFQAMAWSEAQRVMREGRADVIDTIFFTEERAKLFDFAPAYARIEVPVYAHKTLGGVADIASLKGFTIGVKAGDAVIDYLSSRGIASLKEYPSYEAVILAAKSQEIKVFTVDQPAAVYFLYRHGLATEFRESFVLYTGAFHRAVRKRSPELLRLVQEGFGKISRREYRAIERKWMGAPFLFKEILRKGERWLLGGLAVLLTLALGNVLLGRLVHAKTAKLRAALEDVRKSLAARQASEAALRENHELFQLFMRHSPIFSFIKDVTATESRVLMASDNFEQMIGIRGSDLTGKTMAELFPPEFAAKITADDWSVVSKGEVLKLDEELNGRYYTTIKFPIVRYNKTLLAGYTIDITDRTRAEQALALALERYDLLAKQNRVVTWSIDVHGLYTGLGSETRAATGYNAEDLVGKKHFYDVHPRQGREEFKAKVFGHIERGEPIKDLVHPAFTPSGDIAWFSSNGIPTRDAQGNIVGYWGTSADITDRKRADAERERLIRAIEQSTETVLITDAAGILLYVNPEFTRSTGYTREEVVGKSAHIFLSDLHDPAVYHQIWKTLEDGNNWEGKIVNRRKDGTVFIEQVNISPVRDEVGRIINFVAVDRDITQRIRGEEEKAALQEQLTHAQKLESIGRLAGGVAHDFNNMLQAILGYTEMALDQVPPEQPLHDDLLEIKKAAQRSTHLTGQLQTFARKQVVTPQAVNLNEAVKNMSAMLRRLIGEHIGLEWKPGPGPCVVMMDPGQIDQIVANLCINARDAIGASGNIVIETGNVHLTDAEVGHLGSIVPGDYVTLSVGDNGCGIPPEIRDRIFEPFFTTKPLGQGTGLGLSIVYGIVIQNGGNIRVDSEPGKGSVFHVYLPRYSGETGAAETPAETGTPDAAAHETLLLVDDEKSILQPTRRILESLGYRVFAAASAKEALQLFEGHADQIDLLISDVVMPGMSGPDMARQMLERRAGLKCLFISGHTGNLLSGQNLSALNASCIQKPFSRTALAQKVRDVLGKH